MRKHIVLTSMSGAYGGMEIRMLQEAKILLSQKYKVTILVNYFKELGKLKSELPTGVRLIVLPIPYFFENWRFRTVNKLFSKVFYKLLFTFLKPDLIHTFMCWTTYGLTHIWGASYCKIPNIISVHNVFINEPLGLFINQQLPATFQYTKKIYSVSDSAKIAFDQIYDKYFNCESVVIPNWVSIDRFYPDESKGLSIRKALGISENSVVIGCIARISEQKNLFYLIDSFTLILKSLPSSFLVLVGTGELDDDIQRYINEKGLASSCRFVGFVKNTEDYFRAFNIHALMSLREGFGISTIEAMASGCVCVVSDIPGSRDVIHNDSLGLKVPLDDVKNVSLSILELLSSDSIMQRIRRVGIIESKRYSEKTIKTEIVAFYQSVLNH